MSSCVQPHGDIHRFEKISNIIKQFKLSCGKMQSQFQGMMVGNSSFSAYVDSFTSNTYVMVILSNPLIRTYAASYTWKAAVVVMARRTCSVLPADDSEGAFICCDIWLMVAICGVASSVCS